MEDIDTVLDAVETTEETDAGLDAEPRIYELGYHIIPAVAEENAPQEAQALKDSITKNGGKVIADEAPQHITLAYTMYRTENGTKEKFDTAHFGTVKFEMNPEGVASLKEVLDQNKNVLRYVIFKTVRENTRSDYRFPQQRTERKQGDTNKPAATKSPEAPEEKPEVSDEELDKSIKELVE